MKKAKKLGLQSLALVLMAFVLVAGVAFGMTGAWFTDKVVGTQKTLNFGTIDISVTESTPLGVYRSSTSIASGEVMPGDHVKVELAVAKAAESDEDFFYVVKLTATIGEDVIANLSNAWTGKTATTAFASDETYPPIDFELDGDVYGNAYQGKAIVLNYEVRAIQAANQTAGDAWTLLTGNGLDWSTATSMAGERSTTGTGIAAA